MQAGVGKAARHSNRDLGRQERLDAWGVEILGKAGHSGTSQSSLAAREGRNSRMLRNSQCIHGIVATYNLQVRTRGSR
jgi:hypothetical protein